MVKYTWNSETPHISIQEQWSIDRWQDELEMVSVEERYIVYRFTEVVRFQRGLSPC